MKLETKSVTVRAFWLGGALALAAISGCGGSDSASDKLVVLSANVTPYWTGGDTGEAYLVPAGSAVTAAASESGTSTVPTLISNLSQTYRQSLEARGVHVLKVVCDEPKEFMGTVSGFSLTYALFTIPEDDLPLVDPASGFSQPDPSFFKGSPFDCASQGL